MNSAPVRPLALALLVLLALAGCGPLAPGDTTRVEYREDATYVVPAGTALIASIEVPAGRTGLTAEAVRRAGLTWIPLGARGESANASRLVGLEGIEAPEGWEVRLWQARIVRATEPGTRESAPASGLEAEVRVDVPASAYDLTRRVRGELVVRGGARLPIDFLVQAE